ncbi:MAG: hypothetical protein CBC04_02340 [Verrucomicrobia bacterium TMED44]|nr:MAG: hypothetical protein CBC04_02340 [Verrucomicrobia bacterium TMED44]
MHGSILLTAGAGSRMGPAVADKILEKIGTSNAFRMSFRAFSKVKEISSVVVVYRDDSQKKQIQREIKLVEDFNPNQEIILVKGGPQRSDSVRNGLLALPDPCIFAHIHDCARPMIRSETVDFMVRKVAQMYPVAVARPATNTIRKDISELNSEENLKTTETLDRTKLWEMETPQSAPKSWLIQGYQKAKELNIVITDDIHALELVSKKIILFDPGYPNPKITHDQDLTYIKFLINT